MNKYYVKREYDKRNTAAYKAPKDVEEILEMNGYVPIQTKAAPKYKIRILGKVLAFFIGQKNWIRINKTLQSHDVLVIQYPPQMPKIVYHFINKMKRKNITTIAIIHDIESLRGGVYKNEFRGSKKTRSYFTDEILLPEFEKIICHNDSMKNYLIEKGIPEKKLICLQIFDYLVNESVQIPNQTGAKKDGYTIAIAGNLSEDKAGYIYKIINQNIDYKLYLYGINFKSDSTTPYIEYKGNFSPDDIVTKLEGDFGLIWDGPELDGCVGNTGNYLRYNNPHKASLYLSVQMPLIVWKKSALYEWVEKKKIGIGIDSLEELNKVLNGLNITEYNHMKENVIKLSKTIRGGENLSNALKKALEEV